MLQGFRLKDLVARLEPLVYDTVGSLAEQAQLGALPQYDGHALAHIVEVQNTQHLVHSLLTHHLHTYKTLSFNIGFLEIKNEVPTNEINLI